MWQEGKQDTWSFNTKNTIGLNPVLLRSTAADALSEADVDIIFEFVIYLRTTNATKQLA